MIRFDSIMALSGVQIHNPSGCPLNFESLSIDSRRIEPGSIFCALRGANFDGHAFTVEALKKGAKGAMVALTEFERLKEALLYEHPGRSDWCLFGVADTLRGLQDLARLHRRRHRASVIGITGTNGKTSTKDMLSLVLSQQYTVLKTPGNYNNQIGLPLTLLALDESHDAAVIEMGANHPGEIRELAQIAEPTMGIVTNAGRGHLEYFGSIQEVVRTKMGLIESLLPPARGYVNGDDENLRTAAAKAKNITTFGFGEHNAVRGEILGFTGEGNAILAIDGNAPFSLPVPGRGQAYNALAVYAVARSFGLSFETVRTGIASFAGNSNRGAWLQWNGIRIYNDSYNANPDSLMNAFSIVGNIVPGGRGRKFALLGDMLELGEHSEREHRRMGKAAGEAGFDYVYTFGNHARFLAEEAGRSGVPEATHFSDKAEIAAQVKKKPEKTISF